MPWDKDARKRPLLSKTAERWIFLQEQQLENELHYVRLLRDALEHEDFEKAGNALAGIDEEGGYAEDFVNTCPGVARRIRAWAKRQHGERCDWCVDHNVAKCRHLGM
jgi:hypothetical protein